jgi:hypothetical protein
MMGRLQFEKPGGDLPSSNSELARIVNAAHRFGAMQGSGHDWRGMAWTTRHAASDGGISL